jgi:hypothetical protein
MKEKLFSSNLVKKGKKVDQELTRKNEKKIKK